MYTLSNPWSALMLWRISTISCTIQPASPLSRKQYLYLSCSWATFWWYLGVRDPLVRIETFLYLAIRSMAARAASERTGPPTMKSARFSRISFSAASRASLHGTPGSRSRASTTSTLNGRFTPPTSTPPAALISSTARRIPRSASQP
jgi:hypothetical protein